MGENALNWNLFEKGKSESVLDKILKIEVDNTEKISEYDFTYCKKLQKEFDDFVSQLETYISFVQKHFAEDKKDLKNEYNNTIYSGNKFFDIDFNKNELLKTAERKISDSISKFINNVIYYFEKNYNININRNIIREKYKNNKNVNFTYIVDDIIEQLGGLSFEERAIKELKDNFYNIITGYNDKLKVKIKKNKITLENYIYYDTDWNDVKRIGYYGDGVKLLILMKIFSYFEYQSVVNFFNSTYRYFHYRYDGEHNDIFKRIELPGDKLDSIKFFKNGRVDIWFTSQTAVKEFENEFIKKQVLNNG